MSATPILHEIGLEVSPASFGMSVTEPSSLEQNMEYL